MWRGLVRSGKWWYSSLKMCFRPAAGMLKTENHHQGQRGSRWIWREIWNFHTDTTRRARIWQICVTIVTKLVLCGPSFSHRIRTKLDTELADLCPIWYSPKAAGMASGSKIGQDCVQFGTHICRICTTGSETSTSPVMREDITRLKISSACGAG